MQKKRHATPGQPSSGPFFWFAAGGLAMVFVLIGLARIDRDADTGAPASGVAGEKPVSARAKDSPVIRLRCGGELQRTGVGWWETRRAIYNEIPARVRFESSGKGGKYDGEKAEKRAQELSSAIWNEFDRLGRIFDAFDSRSELGRLNNRSTCNRTGPSATVVSDDLGRVLDISRRLFDASRGAFDPTVGPIRALWKEAAASGREPLESEIEQARRLVGLEKIRVVTARDGTRSATLPPGGAMLDLGAVAKGYAVDRVRAMLQERGVGSALVVLGGEIAAFGKKDGRPWRIGIQHPRDGRAVWGTVEINGELRASTSGNYRQPIEIGDRVYYHIFDPRTGRPVPIRIKEVTTLDVKGRTGNALLDGAATAIAVLGPISGLKLARELGIEALILLSEGDAGAGSLREIMTEGFRTVYRRKR
jgi:thiamine biosynthesis lipoprotein